MEQNNISLNLGTRKIIVGTATKMNLRPRKTESYIVTNTKDIKLEAKHEVMVHLLDTRPNTDNDCLVEHETEHCEVACMDGVTSKIIMKQEKYIPCVVANQSIPTRPSDQGKYLEI
jgi:hypothetical protein